MVWHFRRNTVGAYFKQQRGYGKAEALLYFRHPHRFNALGYSRWRGRIYGGIYSLFESLFSLRRPVIYGGVFGRGLFQTLYQPPSSILSYLPFTLEWNLVGAALLAYALVRGGWAWLGAAPLLLTWTCCLAVAFHARVDARAASLQGRLLIALLTYLGPLLRCLERYRWLARGVSAFEPINRDRPAPALSFPWKETLSVAFWTEDGLEKEVLLQGLQDAVASRKYFVVADRGWSDWDLEVYGGLWSREHFKVATEYHGANRRVLRAKCVVRSSFLTRISVSAALLAGALGVVFAWVPLVLASLGAGAIVGVAFAREARSLTWTVNRALTGVARRIGLLYAPPLRAGEVQR
jgi:O-antigen biosynthesis protein